MCDGLRIHHSGIQLRKDGQTRLVCTQITKLLLARWRGMAPGGIGEGRLAGADRRRLDRREGDQQDVLWVIDGLSASK